MVSPQNQAVVARSAMATKGRGEEPTYAKRYAMQSFMTWWPACPVEGRSFTHRLAVEAARPGNKRNRGVSA